jgi:glycosyltransferase involved in cell wall biosynthesis
MASSRMLLSAIVPIGNFAIDYENLKKIIKLSQTKPTELIFILDTDEVRALNSLQSLCYNERVRSFQIIEGTGRNPGASRNIGISIAQGDWVVFCDSDDIPNFSNIINSILKNRNNSDILIGDYEIENLILNTISRQVIKNDSLSIWESTALYPGIWRWVMKRDLLMGISFPEFSMGEDQCFLIRILSNEPKVNFLSEIFYRYRVGGRNSLTSNKEKINDLIPIIKLEFSQKKFPKKYSTFKDFMIIRQIFTLLKNGTFVGRFWAILFFVKYFFSHSPSKYLTVLKYIVKVFRTTLKI